MEDKAKESKVLATALRGALKLETTSATPLVSAGKEFSIYLIIRNPFAIPVTIFGAETHIPIELNDELWRKRKIEEFLLERLLLIEDLKDKKKRWRIFWLRVFYFLQDLFPKKIENSPRVAVAVSTDTEVTKRQKNIVMGSLTAGGEVKIGDVFNLNITDMTQEEIRKLIWEINEYRIGRYPLVLNPGDSVVQHFILKTNNWIIFTPIEHTFQIQVRYVIDESTHIDTIPYSLNIKASIASTLIGSIVGSLLGSAVNKSNEFTSAWDIGKILLTSTIFAIIIVIAFARKNNVQQIISIEDFWGGLFLGFLVGYTGESFINSVINVPTK